MLRNIKSKQVNFLMAELAGRLISDEEFSFFSRSIINLNLEKHKKQAWCFMQELFISLWWLETTGEVS